MGYLKKQRPTKIMNYYQKRYFVLQARILKYFKDEKEYLENKAPKGVINFNQICVNQVFSEKDIKIELQLKGCDRKFTLLCPDHASFMIWRQKLQHSIQNSAGKKKDLTLNRYINDISKIFEFWRFLRIPEGLMFEQAELGDIILCMSKKKGVALTGASNTYIDNICLIVRLTDEESIIK